MLPAKIAFDLWLQRPRCVYQLLKKQYAGQKVQFWEIVGGCVVYLISGIVLWAGARTFGRTAVAISYVLHDISALIMLGGIFIHIYLSTIGGPVPFNR